MGGIAGAAEKGTDVVSNDDSISTSAKIIIICVVVAVAITIAVAVFLIKRKRKERDTHPKSYMVNGKMSRQTKATYEMLYGAPLKKEGRVRDLETGPLDAPAPAYRV